MSYLYFVSTNLRALTVVATDETTAHDKAAASFGEGETFCQIRQLFPIDVV